MSEITTNYSIIQEDEPEQRWQKEYEQKKLAAIEGEPKHNIDLEDETSYKTIKAYQEECKKNELVIKSDEEYPHDQFVQLSKLKEFDSRVDASKGIFKQITVMVRQPVNVIENGKRVTKDALYFNGHYNGKNWANIQLGYYSFSKGWYIKPVIDFTLDNPSAPFDPQTGQKRGSNRLTNQKIIEHTIFLSENKKERRKFLEDLLAQYPDTTPEQVAYGGHLAYRQPTHDNKHSGGHGGSFNWDQFCDLSLRELGEVQTKNYYVDEKGTLRDKDGVQAEYNRNSGKIEAIK